MGKKMMNSQLSKLLSLNETVAAARLVSDQLRKWADSIDSKVEEFESIQTPASSVNDGLKALVARRTIAVQNLTWTVEVIRLQLQSWTFLKKEFKND